jgi:hypothetical protein
MMAIAAPRTLLVENRPLMASDAKSVFFRSRGLPHSEWIAAMLRSGRFQPPRPCLNHRQSRLLLMTSTRFRQRRRMAPLSPQDDRR